MDQTNIKSTAFAAIAKFAVIILSAEALVHLFPSHRDVLYGVWTFSRDRYSTRDSAKEHVEETSTGDDADCRFC